MLSDSTNKPSSGNISHGAETKASVTGVFEFITLYLPSFPATLSNGQSLNETTLTDHLCKFFQRNCVEFPFYFHHENIEQPGSGQSPTTDLAALSYEEQLVIGGRTYNKYDAFFSLEAKRLPTPGGKSREREYVIGTPKPKGAMERFKKGIHGKNLDQAGIIGYIQDKDGTHWFKTVNSWIQDLIATDPNLWKGDDVLVSRSSTAPKLFLSHSKNHRVVRGLPTDNIILHHFWIALN